MVVLKQKAVDKEIIDKLREQKAKEREEKWFIKAKGKHLTKVE
jgi:hypothetical protein